MPIPLLQNSGASRYFSHNPLVYVVSYAPGARYVLFKTVGFARFRGEPEGGGPDRVKVNLVRFQVWRRSRGWLAYLSLCQRRCSATRS